MEEQINLISTFADFKESKSIDRETLMHILEDVFVSALSKKYGPDAQFNVIVNVDRGDLEIQCLNAMGYDVVTLGNHEFDNGLEELGRRLSSLEMPVVCCNYDFSPFECGKYIKPYTILEKAGLKIGVIGVLCDIRAMVSAEISSRIPEVNTLEAVQKWADYLKEEEQCDLVISLNHIGYDADDELSLTDPELVEKTRNIDLVVGGHSHTFLKKLEYRNNLDGKPVPISQDGCWGLYHGIFHIDM